MKKPAILAALAVLALPAQAEHDDDRPAAPKHPAFAEECGSCHLAFPPSLLDANSWRAVMNGLPRHFGVDASLDDKRRQAITDHLVANAGDRKTGVTVDGVGKPFLRVTESSRFVRKHREVGAAVWQRPAIKSRSNCVACHAHAADGDFEERNVRIPK